MDDSAAVSWWHEELRLRNDKGQVTAQLEKHKLVYQQKSSNALRTSYEGRTRKVLSLEEEQVEQPESDSCAEV